MITKLYTVKDTKLCYMTPFVQANDAVAIRSVANAMKDREKNAFNTDIADKELWCLGTYNDDNGIIEPDLRFLIALRDLEEV